MPTPLCCRCASYRADWAIAAPGRLVLDAPVHAVEASPLDAAECLKAQGNRAFQCGELNSAVLLYEKALTQFSISSPCSHAQPRILSSALHSNLAQCYIQRSMFLEAALHAACAVAVRPDAADAASARAYFRHGLAAAKIGLLRPAIAQLGAAARAARHSSGQQHDAIVLLSEVRKRQRKVERALASVQHKCPDAMEMMRVLEEELVVLSGAIGVDAATERIDWLNAHAATTDGRAKLEEYGFLLKEEASFGELRPAHYRSLSYVVHKVYQTAMQRRVLNEQAGGSFTKSPDDIQSEWQAAVSLPLTERHCEILGRERVVIVDDVLPTSVLISMQAELSQWIACGMLTENPDDLCNPLQRSIDLPLWNREWTSQHLDTECPGLATAVSALLQLPSLFESALGLQLCVPQAIMCAAYPPGAFYRKHLDSHGPDDNARILTVLLYCGWQPQQGGALRYYQPNESDYVDIEPVPGRLVAFFSREIWHEVLPSEGERLALTLWIWGSESHGHSSMKVAVPS
jgi:tetratricopeptide (TPR) repeat protein